MRRILKFSRSTTLQFSVYVLGDPEFAMLWSTTCFFLSSFPVAIYAETLASGGLVHANLPISIKLSLLRNNFTVLASRCGRSQSARLTFACVCSSSLPPLFSGVSWLSWLSSSG
jgi:hypothetical protein